MGDFGTNAIHGAAGAVNAALQAVESLLAIIGRAGHTVDDIENLLRQFSTTAANNRDLVAEVFHLAGGRSGSSTDSSNTFCCAVSVLTKIDDVADDLAGNRVLDVFELALSLVGYSP
ncbi:hypothetical protein NKI89_07155 [Mesorhizobium sp. M0309]|uniref:hypothetical protein n=1 Tax=Mesorhizobium sp. M0309 TaxID=2956933 RepID=UPI00333D3342